LCFLNVESPISLWIFIFLCDSPAVYLWSVRWFFDWYKKEQDYFIVQTIAKTSGPPCCRSKWKHVLLTHREADG